MFRCTRCNKEINSLSAPDRCPHCGVYFSGVRCDVCGYTGSKFEFMGSHCPKCSNRVFIPNSYETTSRPMTKNEKIWLWSILGIIAFIVAIIIVYFNIYQPYLEKIKISKIKQLIELNSGTFIDERDGNTYKTIKIGNQIWMAENLRYLPSVVGPRVFSYYAPYYYVYGYNGTKVTDAKLTVNYKIFGVLYNWEAAKAACPKGWHLPTDSEWSQLSVNVGGNDIASKLIENRDSLWNWLLCEVTNETGFSAIPGGSFCKEQTYLNGVFMDTGSSGKWWSSSVKQGLTSWYRCLNCYGLQRDNTAISNGLSVRCVMN